MLEMKSRQIGNVHCYGWVAILTGSLVGGLALPGWSETTSPPISPEHEGLQEEQPETPEITDLRSLQQHRPATTVQEWFAQSANAPIPITRASLNQTAAGLEIVLETAEGQPLPLDTAQFRTEGNSRIVDIPNTVLALPDTQEFRVSNPTDAIATIRVVQQEANSIRVSVTGIDALPQSAVTLRIGALTYSLTPTADEPDEEFVVIVTTEREGYRVPNATSATRTDTPIRDVPQSIQVVPRQVLEDQQVQQVGEALRNVSGVSTRFSSLTPSGDAPIIRGFASFDYFHTNGIRNLGAGNAFQLETTQLERLEVLKGPASVLYGQGEPGGLVNLVTKLPTAQPFYEVEGTIGNFNFYRPSVDISGPLNAERTIGYRLNLLYQNSDTFVDFVDIERFFAAPVFSFQLGENTSLIVEGSYLRDSRLIYPGLPAVGTVLPNPLGRIPRSRYLGEPGFGNVIYENFNVGYRLEHQFSENLSVRNAFRADIAPVVNRDLIGLGRLDDDNRTVNRDISTTSGGTQTYSLVTDVLGKLTTSSITHDLLFGVELRRQHESFELFFGGDTLDVFNPVYGSRDFGLERGYDATQIRNYLGIYAQNLISFSDNFKLLLGGRFDLANQRYEGRLEDEGTLSQQDEQFSPRVGIVYQPIPPVSLYTSWSRSFLPQGDFGDRNADGTPFRPTTGEQFEVGIKTEFINGRLAATLAAYHITKQNILTDDPDRPDFRIQVGEQRSQGIEFDIVGEVLPGLRLIANYAFTDAEITEDNQGFQGNQPNNVPRHSGSIWATYQIQQGDLQGLGFGLGVFAVGNRTGDLGNTFDLPGYSRTDASIFYNRDRWRVQLNVKNLFGANYFENAISRNSVNPGAPFTILGTVSVSF